MNTQYRLLVGDFKLRTKLKSAKSHIAKRRIWKLRRPFVRLEYNQCVQQSLTNFNGENVNDCWEESKSCLPNSCDNGTPRRKENSWWMT